VVIYLYKYKREEYLGKIYINNQEVDFVDYSDTTSMCQFCRIVTKEGKEYIVKIENLKEEITDVYVWKR
jgi:hypothetical protein